MPQTDDFSDGVLASGKTWVDPYSNVSISVGSGTSSGLAVTVSYGAIPCTAANPGVTISPLNPSAYAGNNVNYTVSVTNNDSAACSSRAFDLSSLLPGWTTSFSQSTLTIAPSSSGSATMTKSVPPTATPATYAVDANVTGGSTSGTGNANLTVMPMPPALTVIVSVPAPSYTVNSTIPISAIVMLGSNPASGASVTFTMTNPKGSVSTRKVTTNASGVAVWSYKVGPKDPKGTYQVTAKAAYNSQTASTSTPAIFMVN